MSPITRLSQLIARQGLTVAAVLAIVGVASIAGAVWVVATPPTETTTEQTAIQSVSADTRTSAIVTGNTTLYDRGERLEDMPVYFLGPTPLLTVTVVTDTPDGVETTVSHRLRLVQRATRDGQVFFSTNRTFIDRQGVVSTDRVSSTTDLNISSLRSEIDRNRGEIGSVGAYQARLELTVQYRTDRYEGTLSAATPIVFTSGAYWFDQALADSQQHSTPVTREETRPADAGTYGGLALVGLLSLALAGAVVYLRREIDVDAMPVEYYHDEYDEWISNGEFPTGTDKRYISINTLEDLVDIAIDSNKRVIFDASLEVYSVVDGDLVYYFSRDPFNIDVWLDT